ncbi:cell adhesion molecule 3-like [Neolamprologus brichardi]|uniref:cell adhesion molecule 3-like n=1 Tax=Neolamprologus brichardi TaxID=32507 RepID=UPI001643E3FA|nr:cell adhesion molecule 3-like [Neolamprologus brichardi]
MWPFIFSCLIACIGKLVSTSCPLDITPPRVVVRFGDSLSANCTSSSDQIEGMGWESLYGGVDLTEGVSSLLFKIDSVPAWEIVPMCYMNSRDGARSLSVVWHKGNKILSSQTFDESSPSPVSKSSVLTLTAHRDDDGAEIWCEAKLNLWTEEQGPPPVRSEAHNVNVLYPPTFTNDPNENLEMTVRSKISLNCTARGNPMPSYHWQFPNFTQVWYRSHDVNHPILTPLSKFPGVYICTASNSQGIVTKYFIVTEAPRFTTMRLTARPPGGPETAESVKQQSF